MLALTGAGVLGAAALPRIARAADPGATTFPFEYVDRQIRFAATLDGRGPLTFALDSGAGGNVLFTGAAQRIGLNGGRAVGVTGASGDIKARMVHVDKLVVGPLTLANQGVVVLDLAAAEAIGLDGIVGWELLRRFATTVDFDERTIAVWHGAPDTAQLGDPVPVVIRDTLPRIAATVNGSAVRSTSTRATTAGSPCFNRSCAVPVCSRARRRASCCRRDSEATSAAGARRTALHAARRSSSVR
jgi:aspartyl protease